MSWQEELRRLDAELAGGKISLHEHRKQRDELLAAASGGGVASPVAAPLWPVDASSGWQSDNPVRPAADPPEPRVPADQPEPPETSKPGALFVPGRPTRAPSPADERPTDSMRYPAMAEAPTVITRPVQPSPLPALTPPYSLGGTQPPTGPSLDKPRGGRPTWLFLVLGVVVVLGLIIGATWLSSAPTTSGAGSAAPSSTIVNPGLAVESKLPSLPGTPNPENSTMPVDKAVQLQIISAQDAAKIRASGGQEVVYRASSDAADVNSGYLLLAIPTSSATDAAQLVKELRDSLTTAGFRADALGQTNAEVAYTGSNPAGRVTALWYASGSVVIGIGVSQPPNANPATLHNRIAQVRNSVTAALPAN